MKEPDGFTPLTDEDALQIGEYLDELLNDVLCDIEDGKAYDREYQFTITENRITKLTNRQLADELFEYVVRSAFMRGYHNLISYRLHYETDCPERCLMLFVRWQEGEDSSTQKVH